MTSETRLQRPAVRSTQDGFTLIEVVVGMLVLALGTLGLMHLAVGGALMAQQTAVATEVGVLAENVLDAALDRGYAGNPVGVTADTLAVKGMLYARLVTVTDENSRLRQVRVDITRLGAPLPAYSTTTYVVR